MNNALVENIENILVADPQVAQELGLSEVKEKLQAGHLSYREIKSDGSTRNFCRVLCDGVPLCIAVGPADRDTRSLTESRSAALIGRHLFAQGVVVPQVFAWDESSGVILSEDAGDIRLHDQVGALHSLYADQNIGREEFLRNLEQLYREVVEKLCHMQIAGRKGFDSSWCYDSGFYDRDVMLQRESGYFYEAFWKNLLQEDERPAVLEEFQDLAKMAGEGDCDFFLHRDFQSRNIMLAADGVRFIDYQAGRIGPLGYDLASLLLDPYANIPEGVQERILQYYLQILQQHHPVDEDAFLKQYSYLAVQRNLQIIGAFAFLFQMRGKVFFKGFIKPALVLLQKRLMLPEFSRYTVLKEMVKHSLLKLREF